MVFKTASETVYFRQYALSRSRCNACWALRGSFALNDDFQVISKQTVAKRHTNILYELITMNWGSIILGKKASD
jgi:hypothetical protein